MLYVYVIINMMTIKQYKLKKKPKQCQMLAYIDLQKDHIYSRSIFYSYHKFHSKQYSACKINLKFCLKYVYIFLFMLDYYVIL